MKFGHQFEQALNDDAYPERWVDSAIPYGQLKKILGKVRQELVTRGYDPSTLRSLLENHEAVYNLDPSRDEHGHLRPRLSVLAPQLSGDKPSDSALAREPLTGAEETSDHKCRPEHLANGRILSIDDSQKPLDAERCVSSPRSAYRSSTLKINIEHSSPSEDVAGAPVPDRPPPHWVDVPLVADSTFFDAVQSDVGKLDTLQVEEQRSMNDEIKGLGKEVCVSARPSKYAKSDLYPWREIFELYLAAQIFFSTHEETHGSRGSESAQKQLVWFQAEVNKRGLPAQFKLPSSGAAYMRFLSINATLLQNLRFQELNKIALTKIIKSSLIPFSHPLGGGHALFAWAEEALDKSSTDSATEFDKKTSLGIKQSFPGMVHSKAFMAETVSKDVCAQLSREVVSLVPQIDDYTCPVCFGICWVPVRLQCEHLFCIRCVVKMQADKKPVCPLCRADSVLAADTSNFDPRLEEFMKRWFRKEVSEKQLANEIERGKELFGEDYKHHRCNIM